MASRGQHQERPSTVTEPPDGPPARPPGEPSISYNRLALVGVVWYLLEFAFIIPFFREPPGAGAAPEELVAFYSDNRTAITIMAVGVSAAIIGRIAFAVGVRSVLRQARGDSSTVAVLMDLAVGIAVVGVAVEAVTMQGQVVGAVMAGSDAAVPAADALFRANAESVDGSLVPFALFAGVTSVAMLMARVLPRWVGWTGLAGAVLYGASAGYVLGASEVLDLVQFAGWLLVIVWMLATGIVLFRRARSVRRQTVRHEDSAT